MKRRAFITLLGGVAACRAAPAPLGASYDCTYCARCLAPSAVSGLPQPLLLFSRLLLCPVCLLAAVNFQVAIQPRLDSESISAANFHYICGRRYQGGHLSNKQFNYV